MSCTEERTNDLFRFPGRLVVDLLEVVMGRLSAILYCAGDGPDDRRLMFRCPGCHMTHQIAIRNGPHPCWTWNGDVERPTFQPSVLVTGVQQLTDEEHAAFMRGEGLPEPRPLRCHSFVRDGRIQFLADCTHALASQTVDLPEWDS